MNVKNSVWSFLIFLLSVIVSLVACAKKPIVIIVDPALAPGIRVGLDQYKDDLREDCYEVIEHVSDFATPEDLRNYLKDVHSDTEQKLVGAILIGDTPHAYQWFTLHFANPEIPPAEEEVISFQYYADLDGIFDASPGYISPGGHAYSFDVHSGEVDWEIWIGVLPMYKGDYGITTEALNQYFEKNHAYRNGEYSLPRAFLQIDEHKTATTIEEHNEFLGHLTDGTYAWTPFSNAASAHLYFDSPPGGFSVDQGYSDLSLGVGDFTVGSAHGWWNHHGQIDIAWVESNPLRTVFFWSDGCAVGNLDHADNFLTSVIYSPTSMALVAKGTTNNSGGMGTNENGFFGHNIASSLSAGHRFGRAVLLHVNVPLVWPWSDDREFHFATPVFLGDPTLKLRP